MQPIATKPPAPPQARGEELVALTFTLMTTYVHEEEPGERSREAQAIADNLLALADAEAGEDFRHLCRRLHALWQRMATTP